MSNDLTGPKDNNCVGLSRRLGRSVALSILLVHFDSIPSIHASIEAASSLRSLLDFEPDKSFNPLDSALFRPDQFLNRHHPTSHRTIYDVLRLIGEAPPFHEIRTVLINLEPTCLIVSNMCKYIVYMSLAGNHDFGIIKSSDFLVEVHTDTFPNSTPRSGVRFRTIFNKYLKVANLCLGIEMAGINLVDLWDGRVSDDIVREAIGLGLSAKGILQDVQPTNSPKQSSNSDLPRAHISTSYMKHTHTPSLKKEGVEAIALSGRIVFDRVERDVLERNYRKYLKEDLLTD